jgi:two-component system sensor histidine kinase KdpD
VVALVGITALTLVMLPVRGHLSLATPALVLVIPVVAGVVVGGFTAGLVASALGFLAYDLAFIPPYGTLNVGAAQNWIALFVYLVVVLVVARVVAVLQTLQVEARRREEHAQRLYQLSELLIGEPTSGDLLSGIASTIRSAFSADQVAVLLPGRGGLEVVAMAGAELTVDQRRRLVPASGRLESARPAGAGEGTTRVVLTVAGRPVGLLALVGAPLDAEDWALLQTFANQAALALEQSQLREQALRAEVLEEVDRWRRALLGAVSHDLRTPLATIKTAVSALRRPGTTLVGSERAELLELIEAQSDNLARLVTNLLDMTRIQAGALEVHRELGSVAEVIDEAEAALGARGAARRVLPGDLPLVEIDETLMVQVFANLLENARRYSPEPGAVVVSACQKGPVVEVAVIDHGPGVPESERQRIFEMFNRVGGGGRAGLGLAIAKAFVEAHEQSIWVDEAPGGGARFVVTMAASGEPVPVV